MTTELVNRLWNLAFKTLKGILKSYDKKYPLDGDKRFYRIFFIPLISDFFKIPLNKVTTSSDLFIGRDLYSLFEHLAWYEVYDLIEFLANLLRKELNQDTFSIFQVELNRILEEENAPYRMIDGSIVRITDKMEIESIETALKKLDKFSSAKKHLSNAIRLLSDRENPDYENSAKESISAIESLLKIIHKNDKTLGKNIKITCNRFNFHPSLCSAISNLYGWANECFRHGKTEKAKEKGCNITHAEAKFMLVIASTFISYLIEKLSQNSES